MAKPRMAQAGFTLLEILLVIVIIAVTAALVVPSISSVGQGSAADEAKRLRTLLRFAMEETQLSGQPMRWIATAEGWSFEVFEQDGKWAAYEDPPLTSYVLPQGVRIADVQQGADFTLDMKEDRLDEPEDHETLPVVGMVLLLPDGTTSQSNIRLIGEAEEAGGQLEIRPGPAGIRVKKDAL